MLATIISSVVVVALGVFGIAAFGAVAVKELR